MLAGEVQLAFDQVSVALPFIKQGREHALAVATDKRVASLPDVPTFAEAGIQGVEGTTFTGVVGAARHRRRTSSGACTKHWPGHWSTRR